MKNFHQLLKFSCMVLCASAGTFASEVRPLPMPPRTVWEDQEDAKSVASTATVSSARSNAVRRFSNVDGDTATVMVVVGAQHQETVSERANRYWDPVFAGVGYTLASVGTYLAVTGWQEMSDLAHVAFPLVSIACYSFGIIFTMRVAHRCKK